MSNVVRLAVFKSVDIESRLLSPKFNTSNCSKFSNDDTVPARLFASSEIAVTLPLASVLIPCQSLNLIDRLPQLELAFQLSPPVLL